MELVDLYKTRLAFQLLLEDKDTYLDVGREFPMKHKRTGVEDRPAVNQVTIREIVLKESVQKQGRFTNLIKYLLCKKKLAVQLECVQAEWLRDRLRASPLWHDQSYEPNDFNPSFVRFVDDTNEANFTLF